MAVLGIGRNGRKAVERGRLEVLKWARANGCPWNKEVFCEIAGRLYTAPNDMLKYVHDNYDDYDWECKYGHCETCMVTLNNLKSIYEQDGNYTDWIPREVFEDMVSQFISNVTRYIYTGTYYSEDEE